LALLGVLCYAFLLPGHLASQFRTQVFAAEFGISASTICTRDAAGPGTPGLPPTSCPICKGLAAFHLATLPDAVDTFTPLGSSPSYDTLRAHLIEKFAIALRSRGPPSASA
jgi:hypothetical protein